MKHDNTFTDWTEAFDICRERNRPMTLWMDDGHFYKIFPSGQCRELVAGKWTETENCK